MTDSKAVLSAPGFAKSTGGSERGDRVEEAIIQTAWAYYHDDLNQTQIAKKLNISRASVVNYLQEARRRDYVRITLDPQIFERHQLADALKACFKLTAVSIAPHTGLQTEVRVARMTAEWLHDLLEPGDTLGVAWGETVYRVAEMAPRQPVSDLTVVQLVGSRPAGSGFAAEVCTSIIARRFDARCVNLHVPMVVSTPELAASLKRESIVKEQFDAIARCNKVIFAAGTCDPDSHIARTGLISQKMLRGYVKQGAAGVICGQLVNQSGKHLPTEVEDRMLSVTLSQMRRKKLRLLVGCGPERVQPMLAALRGGFATHLATSADTAKALLEAAGEQKPPG